MSKLKKCVAFEPKILKSDSIRSKLKKYEVAFNEWSLPLMEKFNTNSHVHTSIHIHVYM